MAYRGTGRETDRNRGSGRKPDRNRDNGRETDRNRTRRDRDTDTNRGRDSDRNRARDVISDEENDKDREIYINRDRDTVDRDGDNRKRDRNNSRNRSPGRKNNDAANRRQARNDRSPEDDRPGDSDASDGADWKAKRQDDTKKNRRSETRGRWKDAAVDEKNRENRHARKDRMLKVMRLFEDSLLVDSVPHKEKKAYIEDVRQRLDTLKEEYQQRIKEEVALQWTKVTKEGKSSKGLRQNDEPRDRNENKPRHTKEPTNKPRKQSGSDDDDYEDEDQY